MENVILFVMMVLGISHPLGMVMLFIVVSILYSLEIYLCLGDFWYSIVLMLVMISGMMVVFSYMASMVPNEGFKVDFFIVMIMFMLFFFIKMESEKSENSSFGSLELWNGNIVFVNLFMILFLLMVMLKVVWMSNWSYGSARF